MEANRFNHVLIDGDCVAHQAAYAAESIRYKIINKETLEVLAIYKYKKEAEEDLTKRDSSAILIKDKEIQDFYIVKIIIDRLINTILEDLNCSSYNIVIGSPNGAKTFRHRLAVTMPYKGNRKKEDRPFHIEDTLQYLVDKYSAIVAIDEEADDVLGKMQTNEKCTIIASRDKDLLQIPGNHYNVDTKEISFVTDPGQIWRDEKGKVRGFGFKWFCLQMLIGDRVDNIKGPESKLGEVRAFKILDKLDSVEDWWKEVKIVYERNNRDIDENSTLLFIRREDNKTWEHTYNEIKRNESMGTISIE